MRNLSSAVSVLALAGLTSVSAFAQSSNDFYVASDKMIGTEAFTSASQKECLNKVAVASWGADARYQTSFVQTEKIWNGKPTLKVAFSVPMLERKEKSTSYGDASAAATFVDKPLIDNSVIPSKAVAVVDVDRAVVKFFKASPTSISNNMNGLKADDLSYVSGFASRYSRNGLMLPDASYSGQSTKDLAAAIGQCAP